MKNLTEEQEAKLGNRLGHYLYMKRDKQHKDRWRTAWGTKTDRGLFTMIERLVNDAEMNDFTLLDI